MRRSMLLTPGRSATAVLVFTLAFVPSARAVETCKVKVNAKDGTILVSAKAVGANPRWGHSPTQCFRQFSNEGTCISDGQASKCELGASGTPGRITPPTSCTLYLCDDAPSTCAAYIKKCTPGLRGVDFGVITCIGAGGTDSDSCVATCPTGFRATGGGCNMNSGSTTRRVVGSSPNTNPPTDWGCEVEGSGFVQAVGHAVCLRSE